MLPSVDTSVSDFFKSEGITKRWLHFVKKNNFLSILVLKREDDWISFSVLPTRLIHIAGPLMEIQNLHLRNIVCGFPWFPLTHFSIKNFWCIYDYMLKKGLTVCIFNISTFSMVLCGFLLHIVNIFPKTNNFWNKKVVKHCLTVVNYLGKAINTNFSTVNHYLTNWNTKNWLWTERVIM